MTRFVPTTKGKTFTRLAAADTIRINDFLKKSLIKTPEGVYYREEWNDERVLIALKDPRINLEHIARLRKKLFGKYVLHGNPNASTRPVKKQKTNIERLVKDEVMYNSLLKMFGQLTLRVTHLETELGVTPPKEE